MWEGIYIYNIRPPFTTELLPVLVNTSLPLSLSLSELTLSFVDNTPLLNMDTLTARFVANRPDVHFDCYSTLPGVARENCESPCTHAARDK